MVDPLLDLFRDALAAGVKRIVIADPGRPPFWSLCEHAVETLDVDVVIKDVLVTETAS